MEEVGRDGENIRRRKNEKKLMWFTFFTAVALGSSLSCLDMWKVRIPSVVSRKEMIGKLVLIKKISGKKTLCTRVLLSETQCLLLSPVSS